MDRCDHPHSVLRPTAADLAALAASAAFTRAALSSFLAVRASARLRLPATIASLFRLRAFRFSARACSLASLSSLSALSTRRVRSGSYPAWRSHTRRARTRRSVSLSTAEHGPPGFGGAAAIDGGATRVAHARRGPPSGDGLKCDGECGRRIHEGVWRYSCETCDAETPTGAPRANARAAKEGPAKNAEGG